MSLLVLLGSGLFLASIATLDQVFLQIVLVSVFSLTGWLVWARERKFYLLFVFLFPFLPSQAPHLSAFDFLEFCFLSFAFWWAFFRVRNRKWGLPESRLTPLLSLLLIVFSISVFLALLREHYLLSEVFFLKLRDNWNIFLPQPLDELNPLRSLLYFVEGVLFFYITLDLFEASGMLKIARTFCVAASIVSFLGILQYLFRYQLLPYWLIENPDITRINSTFSDPNSFGTYIACILCLSVFLLMIQKPFTSFTLAIIIVMSFALIFTASRAAWGATFLTLLVFPAAAKWLLHMDLIAHMKKPFQPILRRGPLLASVLVGVLFVAATVANYTSTRPDSLLKIALYTFNPNLSADKILKGRVELWKDALIVFRDHPLFGSGMGSFRSLSNAPYFITKHENVHNYFLQILAETGLPAFVLFTMLIVAVFLNARKRLRFAAGEDFLLLYGFLSALVCFLLTSITGHPLLLLKLQLLFWSVCGILMSQSRQGESGRSMHAKAVSQKWGRTGIVAVTLTIFALVVFQTNTVVAERRLPLYDHGFSVWEKDEQGNLFRWTTGEAVAILETRGEMLSVRIRQMHPEVRERPVFARLYVNDHLLERVRFGDTEWKDLKYYLPPLANGSLLKLRIVPETLLVPPNRNDHRTLGVAVRAFGWDCTPPAPIGVYEKENEVSSLYYWTRNQASFPLRQGGEILSFRLLPNASARNNPLEVQFFWNERFIQTLAFSGSDWEQVVLRIAGNGPLRGVLTLRVARTANLAGMNLGSDTRELGVRVEMPFRWGGAIPKALRTDVPLSGATIYGISNNGNRPFRLLFYKRSATVPPVQLTARGRVLPRQQGLSRLVSHAPERWIRIFPKKDPVANTFVAQSLIVDTNVPRGFSLIRVRASGVISGGDVPLMSLAVDDREISRQPVVYEAFVAYYFPVQLKEGGKKISIRFLNDLYRPQDNIDRNLLVQQIDLLPNVSGSGIEAGWEEFREGILIAEPVDRNFAFSPQNCCYLAKYPK